ncbi:thiol-disulfide isomerase/thioredoxin [Pedobacter sp. AK017]|uniref:TlpA family protein disulfide reductase n=1 Tax=Pedobacter sp. AK017 TaxID=2723073 RepID=UPI001607A641|nr:TlpA disulfide reductase family protein [Pedobacter sp. AK017]MBB5441272.1 thiol-disulfide isomerase/thioredoxin [Pedobacter sp. AK017]
MLNWPQPNLKLSELKGKLVLIDFWGTYCGPCINNMPHLAELQKEFKDQIRVVQTTTEDRKTVNDFFKLSKLDTLNLPTATSDKITKAYFPHGSIPHVIWIDGKGKVVGITRSEYVNKKNIERILTTGSLDAPVKKDITDYNTHVPMLSGGLGSYQLDPNMIQYSRTFLTGKMDGMPAWGNYSYRTNQSQPIIVGGFNISISALYSSALVHQAKIGEKSFDIDNYCLTFYDRVLWKAKDSSLFYWSGRTEESWKKVPDDRKYFTYELVAPAEDSLTVKQTMLEDLNHNFGKLLKIKAGLEKVRMTCWVLKLSNKKSKKLLLTKGGNPYFDGKQKSPFVKVVNTPISRFVTFWWIFNFNGRETHPIIDETGLSMNEKIDFTFEADMKNMDQMRAGFKTVGLTLELEDRDIDMVVIRDL